MTPQIATEKRFVIAEEKYSVKVGMKWKLRLSFLHMLTYIWVKRLLEQEQK